MKKRLDLLIDKLEIERCKIYYVGNDSYNHIIDILAGKDTTVKAAKT